MTNTAHAQFHAPLPVAMTSFVGRERDIQRVCDLFHQQGARLVTLTGPGGVGKTRLAVRIAADLQATFSEGVAFVPLAAIVDAALVCSTIAHTLNLRDGSDPSPHSLLSQAIGHRHLLLVLDNFEQVGDAAPELSNLLVACPNLCILVTSRVLLRITGEHAYRVRPLALPAVDARTHHQIEAEAVRLFADRARSADPSFAVTSGNAHVVAAICQRLDGLPLALELVAAKVRVLSPQTLLSRLAKTLPLLANGRRDDPERHRTMHDAIAWSYNLLSREDQALFHRLAVFAGGFTLESAEAIAGGDDEAHDASAVLTGLESLLEQSIVYRVEAGESRGDMEHRFAVLETVREFGLARLDAVGQSVAVRDAHAACFLQFAKDLDSELTGDSQNATLARLDADLANLRAAVAWLVESRKKATALELTTILANYWFFRGSYREGHALLKVALAMPGDVDREIEAHALTAACDLADWQGEYAQAIDYGNAAVAIWRDMGGKSGLASALRTLGLAWVPLDTRRAEAIGREIASLAEALADEEILLDSYEILAIAAYARGDFATAYAYETRCEPAIRQSGDPALLARFLADLGHIAILAGNHQQGGRYLAESVPLFHALGSAYWTGGCLLCVALALAQETPERAVTVFAAAEQLRKDGAPLRPYVQAIYDSVLAAARRTLGDSAYEAHWLAGQRMSEAEVIAFAETSLAEADVAASRPPVPPFGLSPREEEVLKLVAAGYANGAIADQLFISVPTVKRHVSTIMGKLNVSSRPAAVAFAHTHNLA